MPSLTTGIVVGQRVHCRLQGLGAGIVFAIAGVLPARRTLDVVFDNGAISSAVPEPIVRGSQWDIHPEVETNDRVAQALTDAAITKALLSVAAQQAAERLAAEQAGLRSDPRFAALEQGEDRLSGELAIRNIRRCLAAAFPGVRFSARRDGHGTVDVSWTDGPTDAAVQAVIGCFRDGRFDAGDDRWRPDASHAWTSVFGGVEYLFTRRTMTASLYARAIDALWLAHPFALADVDKMSGDRFVARGSMLSVPGLEADLGVMIWRTASGLSA